MLVGLFIGFSFLALIFLVVWSAVEEGRKKKNIAFAILLSLVVAWAIVLKLGINNPAGLVSANFGLILSIVALFVPFYRNNKPDPNGLSKKIMEEIEARYFEEYLRYTDTTYGPSLLGTMNDYNRLLMGVLDPLEEKYPEIGNHYEEILNRLKEITPTINEKTSTT